MTMRTVIALVLAASTLPGQRQQESPQAAALATPAGQVVAEWLEAFNSADSTKLRAYYDRYRLIRNMSSQLELRKLSGGFDLVSIEKSTPRYIEFVVKERAREIKAFGVVELDVEGTAGLRQSSLQAIPAGKTLAAFTIDAARRESVIDRAIENLTSDYVFSEVARKMAVPAAQRSKPQ